jgi:diguanylate cyclase (GGDEF)-like protein
MEELNKRELDQLLKTVPGAVTKLAFDDILTILCFSDAFSSLFKNITDKAMGKAPIALLKLVYSADIIYVTQQIASQKHRKDNMFNIHFRTLQLDGSFMWVMITGNKTDEIWQSGSKPVPVYSCIAMDVTYFMYSYKKLEQANDYRNKIAELSKDLYFEYEIATDLLSFSELFRQIFGRENVISGFRSRLDKTNAIHPDELATIISIYNSMMRGRKQARFEFRMFSKDGEPVWYLCYATIIFDENRNPYKVVGKLATTNHLEAVPEKAVYAPQLDTTTNVCTKEAVEFMIAEAAKSQEAEALSALFVIEIRNFKEINVIRKSISGENILADIGSLLKKYFRTTDIIGRTGLDEFVVYMKDVPGDNTVYEMAEKLCGAIEGVHSYSFLHHGIAVYIGIALHKGTREYQVLMANANTALVMAKKASASSFEVYSGSM